MSFLFIEQLQKIDAVIENRKQRIEVTLQHVKQLQEAAQRHTKSLQIDIEEQEKYRRKILTSKEFCELVLSQVRTALVMLHRLDGCETKAFEKAVVSQFRLGTSIAYDNFVATGSFEPLNSPTFTTGTPTVVVEPHSENLTDPIFDNEVEQKRFDFIRQSLAISGIYVQECYENTPDRKCWALKYKGCATELIWLLDYGWKVKPLNTINSNTDKLTGVWENFDLIEYLTKYDVKVQLWYRDYYEDPV